MISKKRLVPFGVCLALLLVIIVAVKIVSAPSHGHTTTSNLKLKTTHARAPAPAPASTVQNAYYRLDLPVGYVNQSTSTTTQGLLYQQNLVKASTLGSLIIAIGISQLPPGGLSEDSSYKLRSQQPDRYQITSESIGGSNVQLANDSQTAAVAAFWVHGDKLATISVTTGLGNPSSDDNATQVRAIKTLLQGWHWQWMP